MSDIAISVNQISKKYIIGHQKQADLRHALGDQVRRLLGNVRQEQEEFWALKEVSFEVRQGEAVGIIGRNGAGKSTLLKILSRIVEPTAGRIEINGRVSSLLEVGTGFHSELSGRENIYLNGTILGMRRAEIRAKFDEIVAFSGIEKFIDTPVKHYSSGMKVRLAFSVAAHLEPQILIVDEVLAVGDAEFQQKCLGKMDEVSKNEGRTVLFVSHNMGAVESLCKIGITIDKGVISFIGNINESISMYYNSVLSKNTQKEIGVVNLSNHINKKYDSRYGFQSVELLVNGSRSNVIASGDQLQLIFSISLDKELSNPSLGIVIKDTQGSAVIGINNRHANNKLHLTKEHFKIVLFIGCFSIYGEGQYSVDLYLGDSDDNFDIIKDSFYFQLITSDVYKSGYLPSVHLNKFYLPSVSFKIIN